VLALASLSSTSRNNRPPHHRHPSGAGPDPPTTPAIGIQRDWGVTTWSRLLRATRESAPPVDEAATPSPPHQLRPGQGRTEEEMHDGRCSSSAGL
jgi:hypothetical protein